jgi:hypothetical protein
MSPAPIFGKVTRAGEVGRGHLGHHLVVRKSSSRGASALFAACAAVAGSQLAVAQAHSTGDPPLLVPWNRIGNITLGESKTSVEREYGSVGHGFHVIQRYENVQGYYRLHGDRVIVTFYGNRVGELEFETPYYRTKTGFGVGSRIPLGPCHRTATNPCEHRWRGFIYNPTLRVRPCNCWVKVGRGAQSLPANAFNFGKPWFIIYLRHGHVAGFYFALKYVD